MRITMAQLNPVVGDIEGNVSRILDVLPMAAKDRADLVVLPELIVTGYPPEDLLEFPGFVSQVKSGLDRVVAASGNYRDLGIVLGAPAPTGQREGKPLFNAAFLVNAGKVLFRQPKMLLPTYDVFDELRYFKPGDSNDVVPFKNERLGLSVCEDFWNEPGAWTRRLYPFDPIDMLAKKGATLLINISASPFSAGKEAVRYRLLRDHAEAHGLKFVFVNQIGGNDDLVFDGTSLVVDEEGAARCVLPSFEEAVVTIDTAEPAAGGPYEPADEIVSVRGALVLGTRDYVRKCGFAKAVIGLSGGIDSAVTAAIAAEALGSGNVLGIAMPSPYSSKESLEDAQELARNLGIGLEVVGISALMEAYGSALGGAFKGLGEDATEENIQARIRGNILMAFSNKFGFLPLSTGNKSELAVGYCTLYGDMSGGLAVISDLPKTMVFELARHYNSGGRVIPERTISKAPSAELKPDQKDQDTLPPYDVLDRILDRHIDRHESVDEIVAAGFDAETVTWVVDAVRKNEHKRKQAAPGIKVTSKAFGSGRRMPIAAKYRV
jgi:NAD+ synthase (glutamine-hydrolysing)